VQSDDVHGGAAPTKARDGCERHRQPEPGQLGHRIPEAHLAVQLGQGLGQEDQTLPGQPQPMGATSVAFPSISTGAYGYPLAEAAAVSMQALCGAVTAVQSVLLVAFSSQVQELWEQALEG